MNKTEKALSEDPQWLKFRNMRDDVEEISENLDLAISGGLRSCHILDIMVNERNVLKGLIDMMEEFSRPVNLLSDQVFEKNIHSMKGNPEADWKEFIKNGPGQVFEIPDRDAGLKLWLCTTDTNKTYFAHALDEDQARTMVDEIYGEGTVINVFNFNNEYQVMKEL